MAKHKTKGKYGEAAAAQFLEEKGYTVLKRNYRYKKAEVDLIVSKENLIVFVEVKLRKNKSFGTPEAFVSRAQQNRILDAAEAYQEEELQTDDSSYHIRFDVISILGIPPSLEIEHFEDAFY